MIGSIDRGPRNEKERISIRPITFELTGGVSLELHAHIDDATGQLLSITDKNGSQMTGRCTVYDTYFDERALGDIKALFDSWGVSFRGSAWEVDDQEDLPGYIQFSWDNFNTAIKRGTIVFEKDAATGIWFIEELFNVR